MLDIEFDIILTDLCIIFDLALKRAEKRNRLIYWILNQFTSLELNIKFRKLNKTKFYGQS